MGTDINKEYFDWLCNMVCADRYSEEISFKKLLTTLHETEFIFINQMDSNRASDGVAMRRKYALEQGNDKLADGIEGPCSIFEMMVALAVRCEHTIMLDPAVGDRTGQWFWGMVTNLGLGSMEDNRYDERFANKTIATFLNREYEADGKGGLFTVKNCEKDLRDAEIWFQMCRYLDQFVYLTEGK